MKKRDIIRILDIASMVSIIIACVFVVVYQSTGGSSYIRFAVVMYTASFLILTVFYSIKTYFVYAKTMEENQVIFELSKKEKAYLIAKLVLSAIAFIFTLIILILN